MIENHNKNDAGRVEVYISGILNCLMVQALSHGTYAITATHPGEGGGITRHR